MATSKITWENKEGIQNDESIARKNKVMDDDMNEIKQVVNNNADELNIAQSNIEDLQSGQSTSNADITNIKNRISTLETDNKTNKSNISALKSDNATNKENISTLQEQVSNKVDKVEGKGLSTNDYTTEEKQKLAGLKNYDDTEIKQNIADIKEEQETQNTNIENLQEKDITQEKLIEKLQQENENIKSALINVETEQSKSIHVEGASEVPAQLKVMGNQEQDGEPSPENEVEVKCLGSNKNLFDKNNASIISLNAINQENGTFATATNQKHVYIECEALTSYSITKSILADTTLGIYETGEIPAVNVNYHQLYLKTASTGIATVKTGENAKYLDIRLNSRALTEEELQEILDTLKIEEGDNATSYSPYRTR